MVYPNSVLPLTLLLGTSRVVTAAASSLPLHDSRDLSIYKGAQSSETPISSGIAIDRITTRPSTKFAGRRRITGPIESVLGAASPSNTIEITTTKTVSRLNPISKAAGIPPIGIPIDLDGEDPAGNAEQTLGWSDVQQMIRDGVDGYLNIVGASDDGPMAVKIASLEFPEDNTGNNLFELGPETELGSVVFLAPMESPSAPRASPGPEAFNQTVAMFDARFVPSSIFSIYNTTSSSATIATAPITVRLKAEVSVRQSVPRENLCVTYNKDYNQIEGESPMRLERCDDSYIPGVPSAFRASSETQLWQYDPVTREVRPLLLESKVDTTSTAKKPPPSTLSQMTIVSGMVVVETAPPVSGAASTTVVSAEAAATTSTGVTNSVKSNASYGNIARRAEDDDISADEKRPNPASMKPLKPDVVAQQQGFVGPSFAAMQIVDPYHLMFSPSTTIGHTSLKTPRPAA